MIWPNSACKIQRVERDAELVGHAAGVLGVGRRAAALLVVERERGAWSGERAAASGVRSTTFLLSARLLRCSTLVAAGDARRGA